MVNCPYCSRLLIENGVCMGCGYEEAAEQTVVGVCPGCHQVVGMHRSGSGYVCPICDSFVEDGDLETMEVVHEVEETETVFAHYHRCPMCHHFEVREWRLRDVASFRCGCGHQYSWPELDGCKVTRVGSDSLGRQLCPVCGGVGSPEFGGGLHCKTCGSFFENLPHKELVCHDCHDRMVYLGRKNYQDQVFCPTCESVSWIPPITCHCGNNAYLSWQDTKKRVYVCCECDATLEEKAVRSITSREDWSDEQWTEHYQNLITPRATPRYSRSIINWDDYDDGWLAQRDDPLEVKISRQFFVLTEL